MVNKKCKPETKIILEAIQAATEDIAELLFELPNQKLFDTAALIQHLGAQLQANAEKSLKNIGK